MTWWLPEQRGQIIGGHFNARPDCDIRKNNWFWSSLMPEFELTDLLM
jgi:hypothetical protein